MSQPAGSRAVLSAEHLDLLSVSARLLFENGETTNGIMRAVNRLGAAWGVRASILLRWGELILRVQDGGSSPYGDIIAASPLGVDMSKVAATIASIDELCSGRGDPKAARSALEKIAHFPPVSLARFALMAGAAAGALGVIFGARSPLALVLIAVSAAAGACLRRWLARISDNPFIQPFAAALLAGLVGAIAVRLQLSSAQRLVAVCPCMVLVPGPHVLSGMIDLARARVALGASRVAYAGMITLTISIGLVAGLSLGGVDLPVSEASPSVPLGYDVIAAGVAVAGYGTFFAMPWRMLPIPILIGMAAHAAHWAMTALAGASTEAAALVASLLVGTVVTPIADRLRLPFAAFAFASVVSLIPGVYLFRMAGGLVGLMNLGGDAQPVLLIDTVVDGTTALVIVLAITFGLIFPKMCIEHFYPGLTESAAEPPMNSSTRQ
jgi:uncharacterized membrane protein YjjB (DUF3815 family)